MPLPPDAIAEALQRIEALRLTAVQMNDLLGRVEASRVHLSSYGTEILQVLRECRQRQYAVMRELDILRANLLELDS